MNTSPPHATQMLHSEDAPWVPVQERVLAELLLATENLLVGNLKTYQTLSRVPLTGMSELFVGFLKVQQARQRALLLAVQGMLSSLVARGG